MDVFAFEFNRTTRTCIQRGYWSAREEVKHRRPLGSQRHSESKNQRRAAALYDTMWPARFGKEWKTKGGIRLNVDVVPTKDGKQRA